MEVLFSCGGEVADWLSIGETAVVISWSLFQGDRR